MALTRSDPWASGYVGRLCREGLGGRPVLDKLEAPPVLGWLGFGQRIRGPPFSLHVVKEAVLARPGPGQLERLPLSSSSRELSADT